MLNKTAKVVNWCCCYVLDHLFFYTSSRKKYLTCPKYVFELYDEQSVSWSTFKLAFLIHFWLQTLMRRNVKCYHFPPFVNNAELLNHMVLNNKLSALQNGWKNFLFQIHLYHRHPILTMHEFHQKTSFCPLPITWD